MKYELFTIMVFENRILRGICGSNEEELTGEWRKLHNVVLHFYTLN
jgi:hypothetical protein